MVLACLLRVAICSPIVRSSALCLLSSQSSIVSLSFSTRSVCSMSVTSSSLSASATPMNVAFSSATSAVADSSSDNSSGKIRAWRTHSTQGDGTTLDVVSLPALKPTEVLVSNRFLGLNFTDNYHRRGLYPLQYPATLGREASGIIEKVGADVHEFAAGDRVSYYAPGSCAEATIVPMARVVKLPNDISLDQGAAFLLQGLTVNYLVRDSYPIKKGDTVIIHAAAGATGILLTQVAKLLGAHVIGTCSSQAKAITVRGLGADHVVVYNRGAGKIDGAWVEEVMKITSGNGVNAVYDSIGADTFDGSLQCLKPRGTLVLYGQSSGKTPPFDPMKLAKGSYSLTRPMLDHFVSTHKQMVDRSEEIWKWHRQGVHPKIHGIYAFEDAIKMLNEMEKGETSGKLLLKTDV